MLAGVYMRVHTAHPARGSPRVPVLICAQMSACSGFSLQAPIDLGLISFWGCCRACVHVGGGLQVCLPPAHGTMADASTVLRVNGAAVPSVAEGRMLCTVKDIGPGSYLVER